MPDLRMMDKSTHQDFNTIVRDGLLRLNGMPGFAGELTNQDLEQIYAYIVTQANKDRRKALEDSDSD